MEELQSVLNGVNSDADSSTKRIEEIKMSLGIGNITPNLDADISPIDNVEFTENADQNNAGDHIASGGFASVTTNTDSFIIVDESSPSDVYINNNSKQNVSIKIESNADNLFQTSEVIWNSEGLILHYDENNIGTFAITKLSSILASGENVVYDASESPLGAEYEYSSFSPEFNVSLRVNGSVSTVIKTGDTNTLIFTSQYYNDDIYTAERKNGKTVVELGDGVNAFVVEDDAISRNFYGDDINYQDTLVYGFDSNDIIYDKDVENPSDVFYDAENGVYNDYADFLAHTYIEDGNTIINAPDSGSIVLVGYTDFQEHQYVNYDFA